MTKKQRKTSNSSINKKLKGPSELDCREARRAITLSESFGYAWAGFVYFFSSQRNARIHGGIAIVVLAVSLLVGLSPGELAMIIGVIGLVFVAEMFNTIVEAVVDLATDEWHYLAKVAKDVGAAAVLVTAIVAVIVGFLVIGPHLITLIFSIRPLS